jgi:hypothetical protein
VILFLPLALAEELSVTSNIRGASILVNGIDTGLTTPAVVGDLVPGMVQVAVVDRCHRGEAVANITRGQQGMVSVVATEQMGTLRVDVAPSNASIDVDAGKLRVGAGTPVGMACGDHHLRVAAEGYSPDERDIVLAGGENLVLSLELRRLGIGSVELTVAPRQAELLFDGKVVGSDAATVPSATAGEHTISARLDGYNPASRAIVVEDGDELQFHFELGRGKERSLVDLVGRANKNEEAREAEDREALRQKAIAEAAEETARRRAEAEAARAAEAEEEARREAELQRQRDAESRRRREEEARRKAAAEEEPEDEEPGEDEDIEMVLDEELEEDLDEEGEAALPPPRRPSAPKPAKAKASDPKKLPLRVSGGVALGAAAGCGIGAAVAYGQAAQAHEAWQAKDARAQDAQAQSRADAYYDENFVPVANAMVGLGVAAGVLAAAGITLVVIDAPLAPAVAPLPGGGLVQWSASF